MATATETPWWVLIERDRSADLLIGPYDGEVAATTAMNDAPLLDSYCEEDSLDCYTVTLGEKGADPAWEVVLIDPEDPDHTGVATTTVTHEISWDNATGSGRCVNCDQGTDVQPLLEATPCPACPRCGAVEDGCCED